MYVFFCGILSSKKYILFKVFLLDTVFNNIYTVKVKTYNRGGGDMRREKNKVFTLNIPKDEFAAVESAAKKLKISTTLYIRLWVRECLMNDPIKITHEDQNG